jgi:hypothetical protein
MPALMLSHRQVVAILCAASVMVSACASRAEPWPPEPADLTGRVVEVRAVSSAIGSGDVDTRLVPGAVTTSDMQRLRIRVSNYRVARAPVADAFIGVDGVTQVVQATDSRANIAPTALEGAFVRIWLRGTPSKPSATTMTGMARRVVVDSIATSESGR